MKHFQPKSYAPKSETRFREAMPTPRKTEQGTQILCPFCVPTHPLMPTEPSPCGTMLKVTAVQMIYPKRTVVQKKMICIKCNQGGGEMVMYMKGFVHLPDCRPETRLLPSLPEFNKTAGLVFKLPERLRTVVEKYTGKVQYVKEITVDGEQTGNILGYFFIPKGAQ